MTDPEIIGYIGCFFLCISFIPQTYALCRDNEKKKEFVSNVCHARIIGFFVYGSVCDTTESVSSANC